MCRDVRVLVWVARNVLAVVEAQGGGLGARRLGRRDEGLVVVALTDRLAVPARALGVDFATGEFLVALRRPLEGGRQLVLLDLVIVVDELAVALGHGVLEIVGWRELVRVPGEVNVEGRDGDVARVLAHDLEEDGVLFDQPGDGGFEGRGVDPVDRFHLLDEDALAEDGADEVEGKRGRVLPVPRHHAANGNFLAALERFRHGGLVGLCDKGPVLDAAFDGFAHTVKLVST